MNAIPNFHQFTKVEKINKGWSGDQKYYAESCAGEKFLLRISDISEYSKKEAEFSVMQKMAQVGIKMSLRSVQWGKECVPASDLVRGR